MAEGAAGVGGPPGCADRGGGVGQVVDVEEGAGAGGCEEPVGDAGGAQPAGWLVAGHGGHTWVVGGGAESLAFGGEQFGDRGGEPAVGAVAGPAQDGGGRHLTPLAEVEGEELALGLDVLGGLVGAVVLPGGGLTGGEVGEEAKLDAEVVG